MARDLVENPLVDAAGPTPRGDQSGRQTLDGLRAADVAGDAQTAQEPEEH